MKFHSLLLLGGLAVVVLLSETEARSARRHHSRKYYEEEEPAPKQVQVEEPKPVEIEPSQSSEASEDSSMEKPQPRPARAKKAPVLCNANTAAANLGKPDKVETSNPSDNDSGDEDNWEIIEPGKADSVEIKPLKETEPAPQKAKKIAKPQPKVVPASSESSESEEEDDDEDDDSENNFSAALASLEEPAQPKALNNDEIPDDQASRAMESPEEEAPKPKARRSKHNRHDVRRIERPHRRRVIFRDEDDD